MEIPGWNREDILLELGRLSANLAPGKNILELGALFGRTTYALGHNKLPEVNLYVVDHWQDLLFSSHTQTWFHDNLCNEESKKILEQYYKTDPDRIEGMDFYKLWEHFTQGIPNLQSFRTSTDVSTDDFPMFDIIIHDAGHDYASVYQDLKHWLPKLVKDGIIVVDDYDVVHFPEVVKAVNDFAFENKFSMTMLTRRNVILSKL